jgi:hypothetical protein
MDSTHYNALDSLSQEYHQIPMVLVEPIINTFTKMDLMQWLNEPFYTSTRDRKSALLEHRGIPLIRKTASHGAYPLYN